MSEIISSVNFKSFVNTSAEVVELLSSAHSLLVKAREKASELGIDEYNFNRALSTGSYETFAMVAKSDWLPNAKNAMHSLAWDQLFARSGLRSFMDREARSVWDRQIANHDTPEFTADHVRETFQDMYENRQHLWRRGLVNVFSGLSRRYATNSVWMIGKKLILHSVFDRPPYSSLSHTAFDSLDDLMRVFCVMDGIPEPDHRNNLYQQARKCLEEKNNRLHTPYFDITLYKGARTAHVMITRQDLLEKVNKVLAEEYMHTLPDDRSAVFRHTQSSRMGSM